MRHGPLTVVAALCLVALPALCGAQMDDGLGLDELGLGGMGGLGALGLLGGLGGGGLGNLGGLAQMAAPAAAAPTVVVAQPALFALGNLLFVAYNGTVTKYDIATMRPLGSATYPTGGVGAGTVPTTLPGTLPGVNPGTGAVPSTLPGVGAATPLQGASEGPTLIEDSTEDAPPLVPGATPATGP